MGLALKSTMVNVQKVIKIKNSLREQQVIKALLAKES